MPGWSTACFGSFKKIGETFYNKNNLDQIEENRTDAISGGIDKNSRPKISNLRPGSIAYRTGVLKTCDRILAVDGVNLSSASLTEALQLLKQVKQNAIITVEYDVQLLASFNPSSCPNSATVARADRTEVILHADHKGFGFHIYGPSHSSDILTTPPVINCIDQGSPAERSGVLLVGDRVLAINGDSTEGMSIERITNMIANSHPRISLITEFDVAEAVVPSSGIFVVKLAKKGADLGISLTEPEDANTKMKVNNVKTYNAGLIVPLIASSGDRIELIISRPAYDDESSSEGTLERSRTSNCNAWADDDGEKDDNTSLFCPISENKTFTKTL
ncbi:Glutamate receptor-interacting protein 1 like protein [Argiope bruennichi]|uniref:Glutamate receptor-interacting protein 1 like protein n=1 Tax=Argiope bruennichi TaxID=94029 RepID=A0A8T0FLE8_ARGBR|nr:Glutamate receptor-interacting protein 1 like protein [Argiope bruennichi]